ncbi:hypothetical protein NDU88_009737 [Pleurodeles waltl]|uniref:Uncharacterized protein n=1 Tax=Pleurodeles waltl TaxID=8319 RepID=A0AAV7RWY9_PLEWA|nr:hypothetical protein NDU88_009737 [Pleurodeles waltl]
MPWGVPLDPDSCSIYYPNNSHRGSEIVRWDQRWSGSTTGALHQAGGGGTTFQRKSLESTAGNKGDQGTAAYKEMQALDEDKSLATRDTDALEEDSCPEEQSN